MSIDGTVNVDVGAAFYSASQGGLTIGSTGVVNVYSANTSNVFTGNGIIVNGSLTVASGAFLETTNGLNVSSSGTATINGNFFAENGNVSGSGNILVNGGSIYNTTDGTAGGAKTGVAFTGTNTITIENGATIYSNGSGTATINFGATNGAANSLIVTGSGGTFTTPITNFGAGDQIAFAGYTNPVTAPTVTSNGNGSYSVVLTGSGVTLSNVKFTSAITAQITSNGNGTVNVPGITDSTNPNDQLGECFLPGTAIATPHGAALVETLQPGDLVTTIVQGAPVAKPVKWVGYRHVKPGDLIDDSAHPVRIKANAFADGVPARDLLITSEHCILAGGGLIPARLLVNGRSIISDTSISSFTYYHVELADHAILLAEGLAVESYLDTGNRGNFANAPVPSLRPALAVRISAPHEAQPAAPILVTPGSVKPVWEALNERAGILGLRRSVAAPALTYDADLHLVTAKGAVVLPLRLTADKAWFVLPEGTETVSLVSRTARPCDTIAAYIDDRRALGVSVGEIKLHIGSNVILTTSHLSATDLAGWHAVEGPSHRWTSGRAELRLPKTARAATGILEVNILQAGPYIADVSPERAVAA
ncbi:MAG: hypothetical protein B7Z75_12325 [Acidocella sp. 20-57-95]|nr:MAG: hypothetical protein B7Z75_12325 [Acidocella sp. 20-57-95]OYV59049.1 MAG: hypothetical protein B7Z71_08890 [Acidocella sp. 21-58-7]HQT64010.1 Hint domain-containing protein [Acidocella sp.]HQU04751.1 Hint domain-containing protein [Acidocella sp.]